MEVFNIISGIASILGLVISLCTLSKVTKIMDKSRTGNKLNNVSIGQNYTGRDSANNFF